VAIDLSALRAELDTDPRGLGYVAADLPGKRALINANPETISRAISPATLWGYLFDNSRLVALGAARTDAALTAEEQNAASALWISCGAAVIDEVTRGELPQSIDLTSSPFIHAVSLVVAAEVLSAAQGAAVLALGDVSVSRGEALGFGSVRESYITAALA
jgi:hypothetical protein